MTSRLLTRKEASALLGCSVKTMTRIERRYRLDPVTYTGLEPVFDEGDVKKAQFRRMADKRKQLSKLRARGKK
jgi:hypothetical protein